MGIAFAAPPGVVMTETFRRGIARGFSAALYVQLGSLIGDATYCVLALAGVAVLAQNPITQRVLGIVSVLFLLYLAISGIVSELRNTSQATSAQISQRPNNVTTPQSGSKNAFLTGMFLSLTNPWAIGFWLSLGGTLASYGAIESGGTMALFFTGFFGTCLAFAVGLSLLIGVTRRVIPPRVGKWVSIVCSLVIGVLAVGVAIQLVTML